MIADTLGDVERGIVGLLSPPRSRRAMTVGALGDLAIGIVQPPSSSPAVTAR